MLPSNERQILEQSKFAYYPLGKAFEKQFGALKSLDISNEKYELKQTERIFLKNRVIDLLIKKF